MAPQRRTRATSHKTDSKEEPPSKAPRKNKEKPVCEDKQSTSQDNSVKKYKLDEVLAETSPKASVYQNYTCMLVQADFKKKKYSFFTIQVVQDKKKFICYTRWGPVDTYHGRSNSEVKDNVEEAVLAFKKKFKEKTKNEWDSRENFKQHAGKYVWIEIDDEIHDIRWFQKKLTEFKDPCPLPARTQLMLNLIFIDIIESNDGFVYPLGILSKQQHVKGLEVLECIKEAITKKKRQQVKDLIMKYYTIIPHCSVSGLSMEDLCEGKMSRDDIELEKRTLLVLIHKLDMVECLHRERGRQDIHPLLEKYERLNCNLEYVKKDTYEFKVIEEFATIEDDTEVHLLDVWKIDRDGEQERFSAYDDTKERMLLWYATDVPSVSIILKGGLKHNPPCNLYKTIDLFSRPRHFWNDCTTHYGKFKGEKNVGFMFLVELPLVNVANETVEDDSLNHGYLCAHTHSEREPDLAQSKILKLDGKDVIVPVGPLVDQKEWASECCLEDTYHVYDESLIRLRYLLKFSF